MTQSPQNLPPPGWYPDPKMAGTQRYWDGQRWTDHAAPAAPQPTKPDTNGLWTAGIITGILFPIVGFIIGIVLLAKSDNRGVWVMLGSIGAGIVWYNILTPDTPTYTYQRY